MRKIILLLIVMANLSWAPVGKQTQAIRVGSKIFTENVVLGQIIIVALEENGYAVEDMTNFGATNQIRDALLRGNIDVYPEYTGTALNNFFRNVQWNVAPPPSPNNPLQSYAYISANDASLNDLIWLYPAPGTNAFGLVVNQAFAQEHNLVTMRDFAAYVNGGGTVVLASSTEFDSRPDGLPAFEATYGFELVGGQKILINDATSTMTEEALLRGVNGINVAMAYTTDAALIENAFVLLEDTDFAQPLFQPAPVFRGSVIRANPQIALLLNPIFATLTSEVLKTLNHQADYEGATPREVAENYLRQAGFID